MIRPLTSLTASGKLWRLTSREYTGVTMQALPNIRLQVVRNIQQRIHDVQTPREEAQLLYELATGHHQFPLLPKEWQRLILSALVARMRDHQATHDLSDEFVHFLIRTVTAYNKRAQLGHVLGTKRTDGPLGESWLDDLKEFMETLRNMVRAEFPGEGGRTSQSGTSPATSVSPETLLTSLSRLIDEAGMPNVALEEIGQAILAAEEQGLSLSDRRLALKCTQFAHELQGPRFKELRRAVRDWSQADEESPSDEQTDPNALLPEDWAWWKYTRGKRAVMLGGSPRETNRARLEQVFQFARLEWRGTEGRRNNLQRLREAINAGRIDLLILLHRFTGHDADQILIPVCREKGVLFIPVDSGYGISGIRRAIENALQDLP